MSLAENDTTHDKGNEPGRVAASAPNGTGENVIDLAAYTAPIVTDWPSVSMMGRLVRRQEMTIGTIQSRWMQYCEQEIIAALLIHKFFNRENDHGIRPPFPTSYS
jgi:hypothetical protein